MKNISEPLLTRLMSKERLGTLLIFILTTLSMMSCKDKQVTEEAKVLKIDLNATENIVNLTDIADSVTFIPLETSDVSRLGSIDKMMIDGTHFVVVDKELSAAVYIFDANGRFLNKIGRKGKAKNEYIELTDAALGNESVYVYDARGRKVIRYSKEGKYLSTYPFDYTATSFRHVAGDLFAFYCSYSGNSSLSEGGKEPNLILYDFGTKELRKDMMFEATCSYEAIPVEVNNLNPYLYGGLWDEVYDINEQGKYPVVKLDYGEPYRQEQVAFVKKACEGKCDMKDFEKKMEEGAFPMLVNFMDSGKAYFAFCVNQGVLYYQLISKETDKVISAVGKGGVPVKDDIYDCIMLLPKAASDGCLYTDIEPSAINQKANVNVDEDGNPVIVKIKMKDIH